MDRIENDNDLLPPELAQHSLSDREIVLPYSEAIEAIDHLSGIGYRLLGWEGWLRYADGSRGHSGRHQGTEGVERMDVAEAADYCKLTIKDSHEIWQKDPCYRGADLYFCISCESVDTT